MAALNPEDEDDYGIFIEEGPHPTNERVMISVIVIDHGAAPVPAAMAVPAPVAVAVVDNDLPGLPELGVQPMQRLQVLAEPLQGAQMALTQSELFELDLLMLPDKEDELKKREAELKKKEAELEAEKTQLQADKKWLFAKQGEHEAKLVAMAGLLAKHGEHEAKLVAMGRKAESAMAMAQCADGRALRARSQVRGLKRTLAQMQEDADDQGKCPLCIENELNILIEPCKHLVCCEECSRKIQQCPICRGPVASMVRVFPQW
jgi:hypothetical protein